MDLRLRESFSACSRRFPTDLCDLFFAFVVLLFVRGLLVLGDGLTSRRHQGEGGREGEFVLWAAILGPNGYRILEFFRLRRRACLNLRMSPHLVYKISVLHNAKGAWRRTDRLISSTELWPRASIVSLSTSLAVDLPYCRKPMSLALAKYYSLGHYTKQDI
jgi:hypothetical protein